MTTANINTSYLGLQLSSPLILGSSGLTASVESILQQQQAGIGAVVLKSLFEEQMLGEAAFLDHTPESPEAADYINAYVRDNTLSKYIDLIVSAKQRCSIPIIASINCTQTGEWVKYAQEMEKAGADALELNVYFMPISKQQSPQEIESNYIRTVSKVVEALSIPVAVKLSNHFTNPLYIINQLYAIGVKGVVLFNRFYEPDIDIETFSFHSTQILSSNNEMRNITRWVGRVSAEFQVLDVASSTGVENGEDAVKMMLAGAKAVQICSVVYRHGSKVISEMNNAIVSWMSRQKYRTTSEFIGKMNAKKSDNSIAYDRIQFMKYFASYQ